MTIYIYISLCFPIRGYRNSFLISILDAQLFYNEMIFNCIIIDLNHVFICLTKFEMMNYIICFFIEEIII